MPDATVPLVSAPPPGRLAGKVALVTGAGRHGGLGAAIARRFIEEGADIVLTDLGQPAGPLLDGDNIGTLDEMRAVAQGLMAAAQAAGSPGRVHVSTCDVRDEAAVVKVVAETVAAFGQIDILVNNAGVGYVMRPLTELSMEEWDLVQEVNLRGPFLFTKHVGRRMAQQHEGGWSGGRIINIASKGAKSAIADFGAYAASKHGLLGLTRVAALELARYGVTVNAVCPNHVTTGLGARQNQHRGQRMGKTVDEVLAYRATQVPLGRLGRPEDTAEACVFLASEAASYITGEAMNVSGGEEMR